MNRRCRHCGSANIAEIGSYETWAALDDAILWIQVQCEDCGEEWDE